MELPHLLTAVGRHRSSLSSCTLLWSVCTPSADVGWHHSKLHTNNVPHQKCLPHISPLQNNHRYMPAGRVTFFPDKCPWMVAEWVWLLAADMFHCDPLCYRVYLLYTKLPLYVYNLRLSSHSKIPFWRSHDSFKLTVVISLSAELQHCSGKKNLTV